MCAAFHVQADTENTHGLWAVLLPQKNKYSSAVNLDRNHHKIFFLKKIQTLPSAGQRALGKEFF